MKSIGRSLLLVAVLFSFTVTALNKAYNKPFWGDEATDIWTTLPSEPMKMLTGHVEQQQTGSPLFFIGARAFFRHTLQTERDEKSGFDWKVSFRFFSIFSMLVGCLWFYRLMRKRSLFLALTTIALITTYSQTIWYAAETRIYSTWLAVALVFFGYTVRLIAERKMAGPGWIFSALLLVATVISAPIQIFAVVAGVFLYRMKKEKRGPLKEAMLDFTLLLGLCLSVVLFKYWNVRKSPYSFLNFKETLPFYIHHFNEHALSMFGGLKETVLLTMMSLAYLALPTKRFFRNETSKRLFEAVAIIVLTQLFAVFAIYFAQIFSGYFFSDRHVIFTLGARALGVASFYLFILEMIPDKKRFLVLHAVLCMVFYFDWYNWNLRPSLKDYRMISTYKKPYCHGPVKIAKLNDKTLAPIDIDLAILSGTNDLRHSNQCLTTADFAVDQESLVKMKTDIVNFKPDWIYKD